MSYKNIIVIGAGGNLGPVVLNVLIASKAFNLTVLSRKSSKSTFPSTVKVVHISDDYPSNELEAAFKGQDAVLSFVGGMGISQQTKFIDAAVKAGVKRFFPSEYGTSLKSPKAVQICPIFQGKIDIVNYLKKQEGTGLTWTGVVCGPFFDWGLKIPFLGFNLDSKTATIYDSGDQRWSATTLSSVGRALVALLQNPTASNSANQYVYIASFTTSQNEILAALEKASNAKYTKQQSSAKELIQNGNAKMQKGDFSGIADLILANLYGGEGNDFESEEGLANGKLGLKSESLDEVVAHLVKTGEFSP